MSQRVQPLRILTAGTLLLLALPGAALEIEPGLWQFDMTTNNSFMGEQKSTMKQCIRQSEFDPDMMTEGMGDCAEVDVEESGSSLAWSFRCENEDMNGTGEGEVRRTGDTITGEMRLEMDMKNMDGRKFVMQNHWEGTRVGDCE